MKKFFGNIQTVTIIFLILFIILMRMCQGSKSVPDKPKITIVESIKYDTIYNEVTKYVPKWTEKKLPPDTVYKDVDTAAILKNYFAEYTYSDTINHDTVKIYINDKVSKNKIISRDVKYKILYPIKTITIKEKHYINQREFYIGPRLGATVLNQFELSFIGIESVFRSKKRKTFSIAAGVNQDFNIQIGLGLHWKLTK